MNIIYLLYCPDPGRSTDFPAFLEDADREKWMPALTIKKGYPSELWIAGSSSLETEWQYDDLPSLPIKNFDITSEKSYSPQGTPSEELSKALQESKADLVILKGLENEGVSSLVTNVLLPSHIPFAVILDKANYHPLLKYATAVLYEKERQFLSLTKRSFRFWRSVLDSNKMIYLPCSVDTRHFMPNPKIQKVWDIIAIEETLDNEKLQEPLFELSRRHKIGVIGDGPLLETYKKHYPEIDWLENVSYQEAPDCLNKGSLLFQSHPKKLNLTDMMKASACGIPVVGFQKAFKKEMLSGFPAFQVSSKRYPDEIDAILENKEELKRLGDSARWYAKKNGHHLSSADAIKELMLLVHSV